MVGDSPVERGERATVQFACTEDDYDAVNILAGARAFEKKAQEKAKEKTGVPISQK